MRIVSWNCNGALRNKYSQLDRLNADIYIIQECENPSLTKHKPYQKWSQNHIWVGDSKNKGLGIFAKENVLLSPLNWSNSFQDHTVKYFLPCMINNNFQLLGVWTHRNNSPNFGYIGQFWKYLQTNFKYFDNILIAGDFNSNVIWDEWDRWWNHSDVLEILNSTEIISLYHHQTKEKAGEESKPTFWLHKNESKPYHIDYFFGSKPFHQSYHLEILPKKDWLEISDHVPLLLDV